ncbi:alpha/beta hydrolase [Candidatus Minimicrobia naudis]|uniref:Alpha/beta hydrolase n=1 Tax=Candidatus Minimicrobia naudis TaxID=2841263 RepID=A0A8F1MD33_9BACT|nr:alpha/beta hydrolase [Candidatus Minimicrobia naudis]
MICWVLAVRPSLIGKSYNVHDRAASIVATLRREFITRVDIVIGHSMGSLAAVELAKQYP